MASIARAAIADAMDSNALAGINKHESFSIYVDEHMNINNPMPIYVETKENSSNETIKRIDEKNAISFDCGDYSNMNFSDCDAWSRKGFECVRKYAAQLKDPVFAASPGFLPDVDGQRSR